ncbi:MAG: hypothetical protein ACO3UM_02900 [Planctomycetota bacterium]
MKANEAWKIRRSRVANPVPRNAALRRIDGDHRERGYAGTTTFDDGDRCFTVQLRGAGTMDWSYEASTGELRIERVRATDRTTDIVIYRHDTSDFGLGDSRIERPIGSLACNAIFGSVRLRRQRGAFRLADGSMDFQVDFARESHVHYDGATGAIDASPSDGSLVLDAKTNRALEPDGSVCLEVRPTREAAEVAWCQVRGPRLGVRGGRSIRAHVAVDSLGDGDLAAFVVGARHGRAVALETVFVRPRRA